MIFAFILVIVFYILLNFLVGRRIYKSISYSNKIGKITFILIYTLLSSTYLIYQIFKAYLPPTIDKILVFIGSYYLGALFYLTIFFIISFFLSYIIKRKYPIVDLYKISIIIVALLLIIGTFFSNSTYVKYYNIQVDKNLKSHGLRIVLVSDIHLGDIIGKDKLNEMVESINDIDADLVIIAGDLVDSDLTPIIRDNMFSSLSDLKSTYGSYFVLGNHEEYGNKPDLITELLASENIITLRDEAILINDDFYIIGRDDVSSKSFNESILSLSDIIKDLDDNRTKIVIDHTPSRIDESIDNTIDLQVSGHTHYGQLFPSNLITNSLFKVDYGHDKFNSTNVIVTSGFGTWGPPIRIGSRSEIVLINLYN